MISISQARNYRNDNTCYGKVHNQYLSLTNKKSMDKPADLHSLMFDMDLLSKIKTSYWWTLPWTKQNQLKPQ